MIEAAIADYDRHAPRALEILINRLNAEGKKRIAQGRERLIQGFETFPDGPMFKKSPAELRADTDEEISDAIVYTVEEIVKTLAEIKPSDSRGESSERKRLSGSQFFLY